MRDHQSHLDCVLKQTSVQFNADFTTLSDQGTGSVRRVLLLVKNNTRWRVAIPRSAALRRVLRTLWVRSLGLLRKAGGDGRVHTFRSRQPAARRHSASLATSGALPLNAHRFTLQPTCCAACCGDLCVMGFVAARVST